MRFRPMLPTRMTLLTLTPADLEDEDLFKVNMTSPKNNEARINHAGLVILGYFGSFVKVG